MEEIHVGDRIIVSYKWLVACGLQRYIDCPMKVTAVRNFGVNGIMYNVIQPDGYTWTVWSERGVTKVQETMEEFHVGDHIYISPEWLRTCGYSNYIGVPLLVTNVGNYDQRGYKYHVTNSHGFTWIVWSTNGVSKLPITE